jgi:hypothetical protein
MGRSAQFEKNSSALTARIIDVGQTKKRLFGELEGELKYEKLQHVVGEKMIGAIQCGKPLPFTYLN